MSPISGFKVGDNVLQGQFIANEGNPAGTSSTGYHVHVELELLNYGESFKYGYDNSSNPCLPLGLPNEKGGPYIYDVTPIPPTPTKKRKKFPWVIYIRKIREKRY